MIVRVRDAEAAEKERRKLMNNPFSRKESVICRMNKNDDGRGYAEGCDKINLRMGALPEGEDTNKLGFSVRTSSIPLVGSWTNGSLFRRLTE